MPNGLDAERTNPRLNPQPRRPITACAVPDFPGRPFLGIDVELVKDSISGARNAVHALTVAKTTQWAYQGNMIIAFEL